MAKVRGCMWRARKAGDDGPPGQSTEGCFLVSRTIVAMSAESLAKGDITRQGGDSLEQTQKARGRF